MKVFKQEMEFFDFSKKIFLRHFKATLIATDFNLQL